MNASPNRYLHYILSVAPHEIDSIGEVWLNDYSIAPDHIDPVTFLVNTGRYSGKVMIKKYTGAAGQAADATLLDAIDGWSPYHTFDGIAYLYIRLEFSTVAFPTGVPNVSAWVKGKKLLDTRTAATSFSNNIPLIVNDYLKDATYGLGAVAAEIDDTFLQAAANTADEMVTTAAVSQAVTVDDTDGILIDATTNIITLDADRLAFTIGDRVALPLIPGEPFCQIGLDIKRRSPFAHTLFAGYILIVGVSNIGILFYINQIYNGTQSNAIDFFCGDAVIKM
jgi:hypothetical protein